jgi:hypothetical protein
MSDATASPAADAVIDSGDALRASLLADVSMLIDDAEHEPEREPSEIETMLGIDPNDTLNILAAQAVQARFQRDDALRLLMSANRKLDAILAVLTAHPDDHGDVACAVDDILASPAPGPSCGACGPTNKPLTFSPEHGAQFCSTCLARFAAATT